MAVFVAVRAVRRQMGMTLAEFAETVRVSVEVLRAIERGRVKPDQELLRRIDALCGSRLAE